MNQTSTFISAQALSAKLGRSDVVVLDASWYLPGDQRDPQQEYLDQHIPGARFFDIDAIADPDHNCPHMLPSARILRRAWRLWGWDVTRKWSFTIPKACSRQRGRGGCFRFTDTTLLKF